MGVSENSGTPKHPKMIIFCRKTHGFVGETHHFRKTPISTGEFAGFLNHQQYPLSILKPQRLWIGPRRQAVQSSERMAIISSPMVRRFQEVPAMESAFASTYLWYKITNYIWLLVCIWWYLCYNDTSDYRIQCMIITLIICSECWIFRRLWIYVFLKSIEAIWCWTTSAWWFTCNRGTPCISTWFVELGVPGFFRRSSSNVFLALERARQFAWITTVDGSEIPNNHLGCTKKHVSNGIFTISTGAGFLPSTVLLVSKIQSFKLLMHHMLPSRELTYPQKWHFEDDFPFPQVGYVNSLEGIFLAIILCTVFFSLCQALVISDTELQCRGLNHWKKSWRTLRLTFLQIKNHGIISPLNHHLGPLNHHLGPLNHHLGPLNHHFYEIFSEYVQGNRRVAKSKPIWNEFNLLQKFLSFLIFLIISWIFFWFF